MHTSGQHSSLQLSPSFLPPFLVLTTDNERGALCAERAPLSSFTFTPPPPPPPFFYRLQQLSTMRAGRTCPFPSASNFNVYTNRTIGVYCIFYSYSATHREPSCFSWAELLCVPNLHIVKVTNRPSIGHLCSLLFS